MDMDTESKVKASMFSGSAAFGYQPSNHLEAGVGRSFFHSITAMIQYHNSSFEELRMEDYDASCGIFGSPIAKLGAALCDRPEVKETPHTYGKLFSDAIRSFNDQRHQLPKETPPSSVEPVDVFKGEQSLPSVNLSFKGQPNVTVYVTGDSKVNLYVNVASHKSSSESQPFKSSSRSKSRTSDRRKSHHVSRSVEKPKQTEESKKKRDSERRRMKN